MKKVSILTHSFLDAYNYQIHRLYGGGLERYLYELTKILQGMGIDVDIHQLSYHKPFHIQMEETEVAGTNVYGYYCNDLDGIGELFQEMEQKAEGSLIYASCIWHPIPYREGSLGICHGINWDRIELTEEAKDKVKYNIQQAINSLGKIVSVDSHFLTYCRSTCQYTNPGKIELIPNFVDIKRFIPVTEVKKKRNFRILYPRRISHERGILLMMAATDIWLKEYENIEVDFAGEVIHGTESARVFKYWLSNHPHKDRIRHHVYSFDEMPIAYQQADLVVIPTVFSEGTSLSCLEAMSSGLPVLATTIGGLNDLLIDGYNGRLIMPTVDQLVEAVGSIMSDQRKGAEMGERARETAKAFDKRIWQQKWEGVLNTYLN
ncbi:glycosyltransferase family 4 protein [Sediminibacillus massiliensis]|uniref:glycosyltransferase family 4 protein n=1 Tax=Sediminibacillus massiliensis TaxID=1926277 RepID=UPI00098877D3|nr:glycosyltransferase family 4 protein [Sediminibacillus massiliensis]